MVRGIAILGLLVALLGSAPAHAHTLGEGYVFLDITPTSLGGRVQVTLTDLDLVLGLDADGDGKVTAAEFDANIDRIKAYVREHVAVGTVDSLKPVEIVHHKLVKIPLGQYAELWFATDLTEVPDVIAARYTMLFEQDPKHRGFLVILSNEKTGVVNTGEDVLLAFTPSLSTRELDLTSLSRWSTFATFVKHGVWHIWIGFDHILFLVALILPSVLSRNGTGWEPVEGLRPAMWNVIKIVTLFTIAHTITLSLAALELVNLPSRLVEAIIAASVVIAALNNIYPILRDRVGWVVFGFGLFHGFGFASVLEHLVSNTSNLVVDLAGFNIGVELGQMGIVLVILPLLFLLRSTPSYGRIVMPVGSAAIALFALGWLLERVAGLEFMPL